MLSGILPAVITPLDEEGSLNTQSFERLLERIYEAGCQGVYVCGYTGEGLQLPLAVRERVVEAAVANSPRESVVIAHVGAASTADALRLARHAARAGASAVSSLPPGAGYSFAEVKEYYRALAAAVDVPVLVYYYPEFSPAIRTVEEILELCSVPNVRGLKFTDFDLYRLSILQRARQIVFNGRDEVLAAGLLMGAQGGIGSFYNLVPRLFTALYEHATAGRWAEARALQDRINDLIQEVVAFPMIAAIKQLLTWSGIECGYPCPPRRALSVAEAESLREAVRKAGFAPENIFACCRM